MWILVPTYSKWSFTIIEPQRVFFQVEIPPIYFLEENLLHASYLGVVPCVCQVPRRRLQKLKMMKRKNRHP